MLDQIICPIYEHLTVNPMKSHTDRDPELNQKGVAYLR